MGKHTKLTAKELEDADEDTLDLVERHLRDALETGASSAEQSPQVLRELATVGRTLISVSAERRAREKARVYTLKTIPRAVVIGWLREQSQDERDKVMMEVAAMGRGSSVLG